MIVFQPRLACCLALLLLACSDDGTRPPSNSSGDVVGSVTRHKTGAGVPGVPVVLLDDAGVVAASHTDALGRFAFTNRTAGEYAVRLVGMDVAGLDPRFETPEPVQHEITFSGEPVDLVFTILTLVPPRVTGTVRCDGVPVPGARIRVVGGDTDVAVTTGAQGQFAALDLTPGVFAVLAAEVPCVLDPPYQVVNLRLAQAGTVEFEG